MAFWESSRVLAGLALWSRTGVADEDGNTRAVGEDCQGANAIQTKITPWPFGIPRHPITEGDEDEQGVYNLQSPPQQSNLASI